MQNWRFAIGSIMGHKMRSMLTMIGIIIGVASVVVIMALGNGMQQGVTKSFTKDQQYVALNYSPTKSNYVMGMNLMEGPAGNEGGSQEVDNEENEAPPVIQDAWAKELLKIDGVKGYYTTNGGPSATFSYQNKKADGVFITGVSQSFFQIRKYEILAGRTLLPVDYQRFSNVMMIDETVANSIIAQLLYLEAEDPEKDIIMYINSPGGSVTDGMAIYDTMNYIKPDVQTVCVGQAASMGAFLLAAGAKGKRFALENSRVMIHQPLISGGLKGQATDISIHANELLKIKDKLAELLAKNTGKTKEQILKDTERDNYLSSEEAVNYGLIDSVFRR